MFVANEGYGCVPKSDLTLHNFLSPDPIRTIQTFLVLALEHFIRRSFYLVTYNIFLRGPIIFIYTNIYVGSNLPIYLSFIWAPFSNLKTILIPIANPKHLSLIYSTKFHVNLR
jgi:hypothetical protein